MNTRRPGNELKAVTYREVKAMIIPGGSQLSQGSTVAKLNYGSALLLES